MGGNREKGNLNQDILDEGKKICLQLKRKKGENMFLQLAYRSLVCVQSVQ